jgi:glycosyltransferase involved in cell wall biosynthesis
LAYLGPIAPEQRIEDAIEMARRADMPLKIAASLGPVDQAYLQMELKPRLSNARIEYLGELDEHEKDDFLGRAAALLLPTEAPSPLPLAVIEALACGTPVIASHRGVAAEVIEHGVTGYLADDIEAAVQAIERITALSRAACRKAFESRFTAARMAQDYLRVYDAFEQRPGTPCRVSTGRPRQWPSRCRPVRLFG